MSEKRLNGRRKITLPDTGAKLDRVFTYTLESMEEAAHAYRAAWVHKGKRAKREEREAGLATVPPLMMAGNPDTLPGIMARAEALSLAAVEIDNRLGGKSLWTRGVEGVELDPGLFLAGEEACCLRRIRQRTETSGTGQPVRVVISTDTKHISTEAAAFIAAAKLAAQFVPLEIWWQGSWLKESGEHKGNGHVFLVPLVRAGAMDYTRLQFVLCDPLRDHASFHVMFSKAFPAGLGWGGGQQEYSALEGTRDFIPASGLRASAESVADRAARWIGLESRFSVE